MLFLPTAQAVVIEYRLVVPHRPHIVVRKRADAVQRDLFAPGLIDPDAGIPVDSALLPHRPGLVGAESHHIQQVPAVGVSGGMIGPRGAVIVEGVTVVTHRPGTVVAAIGKSIDAVEPVRCGMFVHPPVAVEAVDLETAHREHEITAGAGYAPGREQGVFGLTPGSSVIE